MLYLMHFKRIQVIHLQITKSYNTMNTHELPFLSVLGCNQCFCVLSAQCPCHLPPTILDLVFSSLSLYKANEYTVLIWFCLCVCFVYHAAYNPRRHLSHGYFCICLDNFLFRECLFMYLVHFPTGCLSFSYWHILDTNPLSATCVAKITQFVVCLLISCVVSSGEQKSS